MSSFEDIVILFFLFIFGAIIGSFLNVVIYRVPKKMSIISPASHCFQCKKRIPYKYNIPILGYYLLNGKCAFCDHTIASRYPFC